MVSTISVHDPMSSIAHIAADAAVATSKLRLRSFGVKTRYYRI